MTVMVGSLSGVLVVVVGAGIVVAIMEVKLELVVLVVAFDVGIVVAVGGMVLQGFDIVCFESVPQECRLAGKSTHGILKTCFLFWCDH